MDGKDIIVMKQNKQLNQESLIMMIMRFIFISLLCFTTTNILPIELPIMMMMIMSTKDPMKINNLLGSKRCISWKGEQKIKINK